MASGVDVDMIDEAKEQKVVTPYGEGKLVHVRKTKKIIRSKNKQKNKVTAEVVLVVQLSYGRAYLRAEDCKLVEKDGRVVRQKLVPKPTYVPYTQSPEFENGNVLRDYQVEGLNWLWHCWEKKRNAILADEMGLGKTAQVVSFLQHLRKGCGVWGPFLVVAPLSTIQHWRREAEGWTDMKVCVYHGTAAGGHIARRFLRECEWYYPNARRDCTRFDLLITTYELYQRDALVFRPFHWRAIVVDEGHRLRNSSSKTLNTLSTVEADMRLLLTGTPLQNNTQELWCLLNWIEPGKFGTAAQFEKRYGNLETAEQVQELQKGLGDHLLRRVKEDVEKSIPPKVETVIDVELTMLQKTYYRAIYERNRGFLARGVGRGAAPGLQNIEMELRKCCNHPYLISGVEERDALDLTTQKEKNLRFIECSGKLVLLDKLLPKLRSEGHRVLIFSQFVRMLDSLERYLKFRGYLFERLDGSVTGHVRQQAIDRYSKDDSDRFVFLLSTRAGGLGINLTAADTVVIFDSDWNPQNDMQATARCHRIGQTKDVKVYRLITRNTYEQTMFERASMKLALEQAVLSSDMSGGVDSDGNVNRPKMSTLEISNLLRYGAYGALDDVEESKAFVDEDIDSILERRARTVVHTATGAKQRTSVFKSSFKAASEDAGIDVNAPDFWEQVLPTRSEAEALLGRLEDSKTQEWADKMKRSFFDEVEALHDKLMVARQKGDISEHNRKETQLTIKLLGAMAEREDLFDKDEIVEAKEMLEICKGTRVKNRTRRARRRGDRAMAEGSRRRARDGEGGSSDEFDDSWDTSESEEKEKKPKKRKTTTRKPRTSEGGGRRRERRRPPKRRPLPPKVEKSWQSDLCALCEQDGDLLLCKGRCGRAFHVKCLGMEQPPEDEEWSCPDCVSKQHMCLICNKSGQDEVEGGVQQCALRTCFRFYHIDCINAMPTRISRWIDRNGDCQEDRFRCPHHRCRECGEPPVKSASLFCARCPNAIHLKCMAPNSYYKLTSKMMVCPDHDDVAERVAARLAKEAADSEGKPRKRRGRKPAFGTGMGGIDSVTALFSNEGKRLFHVLQADFRVAASGGGGGSGGASRVKSAVPCRLDTAYDATKNAREIVKDAKTKEMKAAGATKAEIKAVVLDEEEVKSHIMEERCALCGRDDPGDVEGAFPGGVMLKHPFLLGKTSKGDTKKRVFCHDLCVLAIPEVFIDSRGLWYNVAQVVHRVRNTSCSKCNGTRAPLECAHEGCEKVFHLPCAKEDDTVSWHPEHRLIFCPEHSGESDEAVSAASQARAVAVTAQQEKAARKKQAAAVSATAAPGLAVALPANGGAGGVPAPPVAGDTKAGGAGAGAGGSAPPLPQAVDAAANPAAQAGTVAAKRSREGDEADSLSDAEKAAKAARV